MLLLAAGCALAAFAGVTGLAPMSAFFTSDVAMMLYSMVGVLLVSFNDYSHRRPITLRAPVVTMPPTVAARRSGHYVSCDLAA